MVEVHFGMEIRIPCLFSAYIAVNRGALQVGGGQYALIFLFYANIAENKNGADDRFLELGCPISPDCDWLCDASDRAGARRLREPVSDPACFSWQGGGKVTIVLFVRWLLDRSGG